MNRYIIFIYFISHIVRLLCFRASAIILPKVNAPPAQIEFALAAAAMNRYRQEGKLGKGAFGTVFKAVHIDTGQVVRRCSLAVMRLILLCRWP